MDVKFIFHGLAIIATIFAAAFGASSSNNKIVLIVVSLVIAGILELAIPFLNQSPIDSEPEASVTIHKFTNTDNFNQFTTDLTILTKNAAPIVIRKISLHFCYSVDFQEPPICTNLLSWQETDHVIIQNNEPFHKTILFGTNAEEIRSTLSGHVNVDINPTIYIEYTTNSGNGKVLNESIGTIRIYPNYSGFQGNFIAKPIKLSL